MPDARSFLLCVHDASPRFERETLVMIEDLGPLVGPQLSIGVVPDWHGQWALPAHRDYCRMLQSAANELLLHGYYHRRARGSGLATMLTGGADEMNGLDADESIALVRRGQDLFRGVFGAPAHGFLPPAWQRGNVRADEARVAGLEYVLGYFALQSSTGARVPLSTWSWDCGRFGWLGDVGDALGRVMHSVTRAAPVLAIHPRDIERGYWPRIVGLTQKLLDEGYAPVTPSALLGAHVGAIDAEVVV